MKPSRLQLANVMSHRCTVLDFAGIVAACIQGENGAGKSTIIDAILFALFGSYSRGSMDDLVTTGQTEMSVIFDFLQSGRLYRIVRKRVCTGRGRSESSIALVDPNNPADLQIIATGDAVTEAVIGIIGRDYKTFTATSFLLQGQQDRLINATPRERFQIIYNILGLDRYAEYKKLISARKNLLTARCDVAQKEAKRLTDEAGSPETLSQELANTESALTALRPAIAAQEESISVQTTEAAVIQRQLDDLAVAVQKLAGIENKRSEIRQERLTNEATLPAFPADMASEGERLTETLALDAVTALIAEAAAAVKSAESIKQEATAIDRSLSSFRKSIEEAEARIGRYQKILDNKTKILGIVSQEKELKSTVAALKEKATALETEKEAVANALKAIASVKTNMATIKGRIDAAEKERLARLDAADQRLKVAVSSSGLLGNTICKGEGEYAACPLIKSAVEARDSIPALTQEADILKSRPESDDDAALLDLQKQLADEPALIQRQETISRAIESVRADITKSESKLEVMATWSRQADEIEPAEKEVAASQACIESTRKQVEDSEKRLSAIRVETATIETKAPLLNLYRAIESRLRLRETQKDAESRLAALDKEALALQEVTATVPGLQTKLTLLNAAVIVTKAELQKLKVSETELSRSTALLAVRIEEARRNEARKAEYLSQSSALEEDIRKLEALEDFCDKVPIYILDNLLPIMEEEANRVLESISSSGMRIEFLTEKVTKTTKTVKDTLEIIVTDIMGERPISMYSGGERTRLVLALASGLSELDARKAGTKISTLAIDEPAGLDVNGLEDFGHCIRQLVADGLFEMILLVAHDRRLLDIFDQRILVKKEGAESKIEVMS